MWIVRVHEDHGLLNGHCDGRICVVRDGQGHVRGLAEKRKRIPGNEPAIVYAHIQAGTDFGERMRQGKARRVARDEPCWQAWTREQIPQAAS